MLDVHGMKVLEKEALSLLRGPIELNLRMFTKYTHAVMNRILIHACRYQFPLMIVNYRIAIAGKILRR